MTICALISKTVLATSLLALSACSSGPKTPDWQMQAKTALELSVNAYLQGNSRVAALELARARSAVASTGRVDLLARVELTNCASRVASLMFEDCSGFERLRQDAPAAERAYADWLAGRLQAQDIALLPAPQRAAAGGDLAAIKSMADPLSLLVTAGLALQAGRASPALAQQAVDSASSQGWRRPLLAWLKVQQQRAQSAGDANAAAALQRRIDLVAPPR